MSQGIFIAIEGTDGSGKGTQTARIIERLTKEGYPVKEIHFPRYGERSAALVEDYLNGKFGTAEDVGPYRGSILYACDRYAASFDIKQWLAEGHIVIANRYIASNMGHQGGKLTDPVEQKKYFAWNYELEYTIFGIPKPDLNVILHVSAETAQMLVDKKPAREYLNGKKRDIHEDDLNHLKNAERAYLGLVSTFPDFTLVECEKDGQLMSIEDIHQKLWEKLQPLLLAKQ